MEREESIPKGLIIAVLIIGVLPFLFYFSKQRSLSEATGTAREEYRETVDRWREEQSIEGIFDSDEEESGVFEKIADDLLKDIILIAEQEARLASQESGSAEDLESAE